MTTKLLLISVPHNISDRKCFIEMSPHIIHDEYIQTWSSNVFHDDKCIAYIIFKVKLECARAIGRAQRAHDVGAHVRARASSSGKVSVIWILTG